MVDSIAKLDHENQAHETMKGMMKIPRSAEIFKYSLYYLNISYISAAPNIRQTTNSHNYAIVPPQVSKSSELIIDLENNKGISRKY